MLPLRRERLRVREGESKKGRVAISGSRQSAF